MIRFREFLEQLEEDAPTNAVGSGFIKGATDTPPDPPVRKRKKILRRK